MILEMDVGNSRIKWRVLDQHTIATRDIIEHAESSWSAMIAHQFNLHRVRIVNVAGPELAGSLARWLEENTGLSAEFAVSNKYIGQVVNGYTTPEKLGVDRWLAIVAGWNIVQGPLLVVDAGSALTVDFIKGDGTHQGGYIVPGLSMMHQALYSGTREVRFDEQENYRQSPGINTAEAVQNGCFEMVLALVERSYTRLINEQGAGQLIFTGGWSEQLMGCFGADALHVPDLVLDGLAFALPEPTI